MLSDCELSAVQTLIAERERWIARIKGIAATQEPAVRVAALTTLYASLREVEKQLHDLGVIVTPYEPMKG